MKTISIRIDENVKARWDRLSEAHGLNQSRLMRDAIVEKLQEMEDFDVVRSQTEHDFAPVPDEEVWKRLGLED